MSIEELKNKNLLADLHIDWEDKKAKFEYARSNYETASAALKAHPDYLVEATIEEKTEVVDYDSKIVKLDNGNITPK